MVEKELKVVFNPLGQTVVEVTQARKIVKIDDYSHLNWKIRKEVKHRIKR